MTMPAVPEDDWNAYQAQQFARQADARIATIGQLPTRDDWMYAPSATPPAPPRDASIAPTTQVVPASDLLSDPIGWLNQQKDELAASIGQTVSGAAAAAQTWTGGLTQPAGLPAASQPLPSDALTDPLGTRYAQTPAPAEQNTSASPLDVVKEKFSDAIDALGNAVGGLGNAAQTAPLEGGGYGSAPTGGTTPATLEDLDNAIDQVDRNYGPNALLTRGEQALGQNVIDPALSLVAQRGGPLRDVKQGAADYLESQASQADQGPLSAPLGPMIPAPVQSAAMRLVAGFITAPGALDSMQDLDDLAKKYGTLDSSQYSPEDRQRAANAMIAVGGLVGGEGAAFDKYGVEEGFVPPNAKLPGPAEANPKLESEVATPPVGRASDAEFQDMIEAVKNQGYDTSSIEAQIQPPITADMVLGDTPVPTSGRTPSENPPAALTSDGQTLPPKVGITPETVQAAHERIDRAPGFEVGTPRNYDAHEQLDGMLASGAAPDQIARFLYGTIEGKNVTPRSLLRTVRTGSLAGGLTTEGKVLVSPIIQTAMRAPVGAIQSLISRNPGNIRAGLQGGMAGLAEGAADALQTLRYGINYRSALTGGAQGGYGFTPGLDVMGSNALKRAAGTAAMGLVRSHGAIADVSAGIGRGAALATGVSPERAAEVGQQWALRSGNYGTVGQAVADGLRQLAKKNPALDVVSQILLPFYRVGYNAFIQGVERSPLGLAGTAVDVARARVGSGPYAAGGNATGAVTPVAERLANNLFGVGLAAYGLAQASAGNITGQNPPAGDPRWSIRVPETAKLGPLESLARRDRNGNLWLPIRTFGPAGEAIAQSAALYEAVRDSKGDIPMMAARTAAEYVGHTIDPRTGDTWLASMGMLHSVITDITDTLSPSTYIATRAARDLAYQATSIGKSFVPQEKLGEQVARMLGTYTPPTSTSAAKMPAEAPAAVPSATKTPTPTRTTRYKPAVRSTPTPRPRP